MTPTLLTCSLRCCPGCSLLPQLPGMPHEIQLFDIFSEQIAQIIQVRLLPGSLPPPQAPRSAPLAAPCSAPLAALCSPNSPCSAALAAPCSPQLPGMPHEIQLFDIFSEQIAQIIQVRLLLLRSAVGMTHSLRSDL